MLVLLLQRVSFFISYSLLIFVIVASWCVHMHEWTSCRNCTLEKLKLKIAFLSEITVVKLSNSDRNGKRIYLKQRLKWHKMRRNLRSLSQALFSTADQIVGCWNVSPYPSHLLTLYCPSQCLGSGLISVPRKTTCSI